MSFKACHLPFYIPSSYEDMMKSLESLKSIKSRLNKGFILSENILAGALNQHYLEGRSCPFCHVKRFHETIVIKSRSKAAVKKLLKDLNDQAYSLREMHSLWSKTTSLPQLGPISIKCTGKNGYYVVTATYNLVRELVFLGVLDSIKLSKELIETEKTRFPDYPGN